MRRLLFLPAAVALAAIAALPASPASASCAQRSALTQLEDADVAFVGRLTERRDDRLVFAVDEGLKGSPGATVEVLVHGPSSESLNPPPGEPIGLAVHRTASGELDATDCDHSAPENLRAAASAPDTDCSEPRVAVLRALPGRSRAMRTIRFRVRVAGARGRLDRLRVDWGDGSGKRYALDPTSPSGKLTITHRFRRTGLRRVIGRASAAPALACGVLGLPERTESAERVLKLRVARR